MFTFLRHVLASYDINSTTRIAKFSQTFRAVLQEGIPENFPSQKNIFPCNSDSTWTQRHVCRKIIPAAHILFTYKSRFNYKIWRVCQNGMVKKQSDRNWGKTKGTAIHSMVFYWVVYSAIVFVLDSSQAAFVSHVVNTVFETAAPSLTSQGNIGRENTKLFVS